jgi:hypothetical protein
MQVERRNRAQLVSTGMYTFYREELALTVGIQEDPAQYGYNVTAGLGDQFLQNCLDACDELSRCAGGCLWQRGLSARVRAGPGAGTVGNRCG